MAVASGNAALALSLACCLAGVGVGLWSRKTRRPLMMWWARPLALVALLGVFVAVVVMQIALLTNDTSVRYVAEKGSSKTPFPFSAATMWSALEGSILLWGLVLMGLTLAVVHKFRRRLDDPLVVWASVVMFAVATFFCMLMLWVAPVFRGFAAPPGYDGPGPNPLLQNHILVAFHPPMLYLGYVGFTVPFAFAVAALVTGRVGEGWLAETRRWTLFSWGLLTAGIVLGAWWSYEVSGWGGYWAWDPVENASFLPWLTATAYLHSVMVQERRGLLRVWNLSLVVATFALTILGTFLARSGVIQSVHAFSNGSVGPVLLGFFAVIVLGSVALIVWRADRLRSVGAIDTALSREGAFMANNLLFGAFAFIVLLGTVFPLIVEAVNDDRVSVGAPFFDAMTMPIGLVMLFLMAVAPVLPWRAANVELLSKRLWWPLWTSLLALVVAVVAGARGLTPLVGFWWAGFAAGSVVRQCVGATRRPGWRGMVGRANGGMVVHLGVLVIAVALVASQSYVRQGEFTLRKGETATVGGHRFTYEGSYVADLANRREIRSRIRIDGGQIFEPSMNQYLSTGQTIPRPSVKVTPTRDLYLNLTSVPSADEPAISLRIVIEPMIMWLWVGGLVMLAGTGLAAFPGRRRKPTSAVSAPVATARAGDGDRLRGAGTTSSGELAGVGDER
ncbi:MAG: heme lyase CcmF/NrfE family subunit [Microthrixaceae bacterium]